MVCKICGNGKVYELYSNSIFSINHCKICDFKYKEYPEIYDFNKLQYEDGEWIGIRDKTKKTWEKNSKKRFKELEKYLIPGSFLEIGPATGWNLKYARDYGYEPIGVETSKTNVEYIKITHGIKCFHGLLENAGIENNSIDNVLISHVIEHIPNPKQFALNVNNILNPGGRVCLFTPNAASYSERLLKDYNSFYNTFDHVSFFSPQSLNYLAQSTGFEVMNTSTDEAYYDFFNKLSKFLQVKLTGRRTRVLKNDVKGGQIDVYSNKKIYSMVSVITEAIRKSSITWGQLFKLFGLLSMGSQLRSVWTKKS
jgi:SAM-dependent methyltransferase